MRETKNRYGNKSVSVLLYRHLNKPILKHRVDIIGKLVALKIVLGLADVSVRLNSSVNGIVRAVGNDRDLLRAGDVENASVSRRSNLYRACSAARCVADKRYHSRLLKQGGNEVSARKAQGRNYAVKIFIIPPSIDELASRLRGRGTDSEEAIQGRLARARQEYAEADFYDYIIVNDDVETAAAELNAIMLAEHCKSPNRIHYLKNL